MYKIRYILIYLKVILILFLSGKKNEEDMKPFPSFFKGKWNMRRGFGGIGQYYRKENWENLGMCFDIPC
jgi:hypothetical protein